MNKSSDIISVSVEQDTLLSKQAFKAGILKINSILSQNAAISNESTLDTYYEILKRYSDKDFLNGVDLLLKEWDNYFKLPSPKEIVSFIERAANGGVSEEMLSLINDVKEIVYGR